MVILFLMDPISSINISKDTTYLLIKECFNRGYATYYLPQGGITLKNKELQFQAQRITVDENQSFPLITDDLISLSQAEVSAIFIRTDPPFNAQYLTDTWLLDLAKDKIKVVNDPTGIRTVNEKIWCTQFFDLVPPTVITRHKTDIDEFLDENPEMILKPLNGYGGQGIMKLSQGDPNLNAICEVMTNQYTTEVICQKYIPEAQSGDKRVLLLNGAPLGSILRVHGQTDHRNNFFAGGKAVKTTLTTRDKEICKRLEPFLISLGLQFVGIDIIGDYLIEVNVTSPTCMQEMNKMTGSNLEAQVLDGVFTGSVVTR